MIKLYGITTPDEIFYMGLVEGTEQEVSDVLEEHFGAFPPEMIESIDELDETCEVEEQHLDTGDSTGRTCYQAAQDGRTGLLASVVCDS
jgi:hypothetical protein